MRIGLFEIAVLVVIALFLVLWLASNRHGRPVQEELADLFDDPPTATPGPNARRWALGVLWEAGVDADSDPAYAAKILRQAQPALSQRAARALINAVA